MSSQSRHAILKSQGLLYAPHERQAEFWQRYNAERKLRWRATRLGDIAMAAVESATSEDARKIQRLAKAWNKIIPREYVGHCRVTGFERGSLVITVDSTSARYALGRQMVRLLLARLNQELEAGSKKTGRRTVRWIDCRVGALNDENDDRSRAIDE